MNTIRVARRDVAFLRPTPVCLICLAILVGAWATCCWAEDRPVIENSIGMKLVSIPAGEFVMGATEQEGLKERREWQKKVQEARENSDPESVNAVGHKA